MNFSLRHESCPPWSWLIFDVGREMKRHRIAAGAIVFHRECVLLVRYRDPKGGTYLAAPGGAVELAESIAEAAVRETKEETGVLVAPRHIVGVEDLLSPRFRMCKIWLACRFVSGKVIQTLAARKEGIVEAGWFKSTQLAMETVYPELLKEAEWRDLAHSTWRARLIGIRAAPL